MMPIRAVFCDVGGPIYDDASYLTAVGRAIAEIRSRRGQPGIDPKRLREVYDRVRNTQAGSLRRALADAFLDGSRDIQLLHETTRAHWVHPIGSIYPDVLPFFATLSGHVKTAIVANQEATVIRELERDGLARYINVWGISAIVGYEKPSPELFRWCLARIGVPASEAVHVGNRLDTDIRPASALGFRTVWVLRGEAPDHPTEAQRAEADIVVTSLDGLAERILGLEDRQ